MLVAAGTDGRAFVISQDRQKIMTVKKEGHKKKIWIGFGGAALTLPDTRQHTRT